MWLYPTEPGSTLEMPTVTAPMTGVTVGATTSGSVSPKSSGLTRAFLPSVTKLRKEKKKKFHRKRLSESFQRTPLRLAEAGVMDAFGKLFARNALKTKAPASANVVKNPTISERPPIVKPEPMKRPSQVMRSMGSVGQGPASSAQLKPDYTRQDAAWIKRGLRQEAPTSGRFKSGKPELDFTGDPKTPNTAYSSGGKQPPTDSTQPIDKGHFSSSLKSFSNLSGKDKSKSASDVFVRSNRSSTNDNIPPEA